MKKIIIFSFLILFTSSFFLSTNAGIKKEVKLTQEINDNKWHKLDGKPTSIFVEFLDGQSEAWVKFDDKNIAIKLNNGKINFGDLHSDSKENAEKKNFSQIIETSGSNWIKIESAGKVIVYGWADDKNEKISDKTFLGKAKILVASTKINIAKLTGNVSIISRKKWGADEGIRFNYSKGAKAYSTKYNVNSGSSACGAKLKNEKYFSKVIYSQSGKPLLWPQQYSSKIKKIVVHHTAESDKSYNLPGDQKVRSIYKYHTITRGWGDIGYNYIIDQKGNIYEGRSGGDYVVGAHAKCNNVGTLGISLMGNFQNQKPTTAQLSSLAKLIATLGVKYNLDPSTTGYYHSKKTTNILGHRNLGKTACPGDNLYKKLPSIAKQIELSDFNFDENSLKEYKGTSVAEIKSSISVISMKPTSNKIVTFKYKNKGTQVWGKGTWLYVSSNDNKDLYASSIFADKNYVAGNLIEEKVYPGGTGTFEVEINSGYKEGLYSLEFVPIINGTTKFTQGTIIQPIKVLSVSNSYQFSQLKAPPKEIYAGQTITSKIKLLNTGNTTWYRSGDSAITIKTYPQNRKSKFVAKEDGYNPTILARLVQNKIEPGEMGTFEFSLKAPFDYGRYSEKFIPTIGEKIILGDRSMQFDIKVKKPNFRSQLLRKSKEINFLAGEKKTIRLGLKNLSDVSWEKEQISFKIVRSGGLKFDLYDYYIPDFVPRFQAGYANVTIQAPTKPGKYIAKIQALASGKKMGKAGQFDLEINVEKANLSGIITYQSDQNVSLKKGEVKKITVRIKNKTNRIWYKNGANKFSVRTLNGNSPLNSKKWISSNIVGYMQQSKVNPGNTATFEFYIKGNYDGIFTENFFIRSNSVGTINGGNFSITAKIGNGKNLFQKKETSFNSLTLQQKIAILKNRKKNQKNYLPKKEQIIEKKEEKKYKNFDTNNTKNNDKINSQNEISVKLSFPEKALRVKFIGGGKVFLDNKELKITSNSIIWTRSNGNYKIIVNIDGKLFYGKEFKAIGKYQNSFVKLANWNHSPAWTNKINDNFYRGKIILKAEDSIFKGKISVINKLGFEDYLKGIAEVPESSSNEKRKALSVVARSYAMHYTKTKWRKFPGKNYDASDSPKIFQKYLGAGYESRSPLWQKTLSETKGEILTYNGEILRTAYFSCSNGKTKTPTQAKWGNSGYFLEVKNVYKSVNDIHGKDINNYNKGRCGHGVGLSGLGAENLAKSGWSYKKILYYYYQGVKIEKK